jgi:syntaxin 1B/2/3
VGTRGDGAPQRERCRAAFKGCGARVAGRGQGAARAERAGRRVCRRAGGGGGGRGAAAAPRGRGAADGEEVDLDEEFGAGVNPKDLEGFDARCTAIRADLEKIRECTARIERLQRSMREVEREEEARRLHTSMASVVQQGTAAIRAAKDKIEKEKKNLHRAGAEEASLMGPTLLALRNEFAKAVNYHQAAKAAFQADERARQVQEARMVPQLDALGDQELEAALDRDPAFVSKAMQSATLRADASVVSTYEESLERAQEIERLVASIREVNELMKDLAALIDEQGEMIDKVADHVSNTRVNIEKGNAHLESAIKAQKQNRRTMCCLFIIVIIVLIAISGVVGGLLGTANNA